MYVCFRVSLQQSCINKISANTESIQLSSCRIVCDDTVQCLVIPLELNRLASGRIATRGRA
jgi:hypothetical protein